MRQRILETDSGWIGAGEEDDLDRRLAAEEEPFDSTRPHIMTVLGAIAPEAMGVALVQEQVVARSPAGAADPPENLRATVAALNDLFAAGGRAIVDTASLDAVGNIERVRWVAMRAPVHIVVATGPRFSARRVTEVAAVDGGLVDDGAATLVRDLTEGIGGTPVRAGAIVVRAGSHRLSPADRLGLRAAAGAHRATGAPILVEVDGEGMAPEVGAILRAEGADPARVVVGSRHDRLDEAGLRALLEAGTFVALGPDSLPDGPLEAAVIGRLVDAGYGDRIVLSSGRGRRSAPGNGGPGWADFLDRFPLRLMDAGLDAPAVRRMLVDNPARALTIRKGEA